MAGSVLEPGMRAHAPGSVTTLFRPAADASHGVSLATADGVVAEVTPATETTVLLDGTETEVAPVTLALRDVGATARVELTAEVPVGCGFGASGAATLATLLAADAALELDRDREALVETAHRAEVAAGTGLGDVFVQARGGLVWNTGAGIRSHPLEAPLAYATYGGIETSAVLDDQAALDRVTAAADATLPGFGPDAGLAALLERSWDFAERTGLPTPAVREAVADVRAGGGVATMAMVGETVVATETSALDARTRVTGQGARLLG